MMNLTMSHPVPAFGDSFTITCYVCGMPSSKEWAQKARSRPTTPMKPYYPFLLQISPIGGAILREDGSTYLCAFCHASLEAQWNVYESQQVVPPPNRKYHIQKFICAVCGVETYRKRIRALPFQEFPFLEKQRQPGSITLGNNPLAVVCLDCSETLWAQSAEYDRWGLPVSKRHFNWMARPPPPEDSVEATVARLPSGETQLPRCPPIEPSIGPPKHETVPGVKILDSALVPKNRSKGKGDSPKLESTRNVSSPIPPTGRKTSLTSTTPPSLDMMGGFHQQPPVVTVAPMSSHTTVISLRKDSIGLPPGIYPQPGAGVYPSAATYAPYVWGNAAAAAREAGQRPIEAYPYGSSAAPDQLHGPPGTWPWLPHPPAADLIRYQSYVSSLQNRSIGESTVTRSPTHSAGSSTAVTYSTSESQNRYITNLSLSARPQDSGRSPVDDQLRLAAISTARRLPGSSEDLSYPRKNSPDTRAGIRSPKGLVPILETDKPSTSASSTRPYPVHPKKLPKTPEARTNAIPEETTSDKEAPPSSIVSIRSTPIEQEELDKSSRRELHIPKKRNWQQFMKDSQSLNQAQTQERKEEMPTHPKKKKSSLSISESPSETSILPITAKDDSLVHYQAKNSSEERPRTGADSAMDLSVSTSSGGKSTKGAGAKFMIEYLCQSEISKSKDGAESPQLDDSVPRTSVIKCAPKVPLVQTDEEPEIARDISENVISKPVKVSESEVTRGRKRKESSPLKDILKKKEDSNPIKQKKQAAAEDVSGSPTKPREEKEKVVVEEEDDDDDQGLKIDETKTDEAQEDLENEKKGNSERQQEDSTITIDVDDDERKNEDLPNLEQFIKETVLELVNREKEQEKVKKEAVQEQKHFLNELGLVTPEKKIELEIKSIVSRAEKKTLPPLKLRVECKHGRKIDKKLKELLLKVALEDPSLFQDKPESDKCDFMAELGMKTAKKSEKTKREIKWRVVLMERMRRELRDATARGVKHEWEKADILKKFADCDLDSFFNSLSFASLCASDEELDRVNKEETGEDSKDGGNKKICINYPKYIPSYAISNSETTSTSLSTIKVEDDGQMENNINATLSSEETKGGILPEPILKIPVVPAKHRLQSESSSSINTVTSDTDDSSDLSSLVESKTIASDCIPSTSNALTGIAFNPLETYPLRIDSLIQCSANYWEQMKRGIDTILNDLESTKEDIPTEEKANQIEKIRKHLKSQLCDIKNIEKRLRATGKTILSANRRKTQNKKEKSPTK